MSTLSVTTLQGLASSPTPTKIEVASGHTLDASNGLTTPAGHIIQIAQGTQGGVANFSSSSYAASSLDLDFTPKFATSKVFIQCNFSVDTQASGRQFYATIYRDSTRLDSETLGGSYGFATSYEAGDRQINTLSTMVLDSPNTTSSIHYELYCRSANSSQVQMSSQSVTAIMICMEVAQ